MLSDERPIQPSKQYIQDSENRYRQQLKKKKEFLQRGQSTVLPCQRQKIEFQKTNHDEQSKRMTKAEQYEAIKKKNREMFGEKKATKKENISQNIQNLPKKISPTKMTVDYRPKAIHIDTQQRKTDIKQKLKQRKVQIAENEKLQYEKMLAFMKKMYSEFEKEKTQFEKQKQYLIFRKSISSEPGISIQYHPKISATNRISLMKPKKGNAQVGDEKCGVAQIKEPIKNKKLSNSHKQLSNLSDIKNFHYTLQNLHQCQPFNLHEINKYFPKEQLLAQNNPLYRQAKLIVDQNRPKNGLVKTIKPKCIHGTIGVNHAVCTKSQCAQKRVTKFDNNWYEVWVGGRYRTIYNEQKGYKVIWYNNGDIKQELKTGNILVYFCKSKKVIQVKVNQNLPFWYFPNIGQLQTKDSKGNTEIIYADGRHQVIINEQIIS